MCKTLTAWLCVGVACAAMIGMTPAQAANGVVQPPNCNESGFDSVLAAVDGGGGGTITFNCGTATIPFTNYRQIANAVSIDGGGTITFDGGGTSAFFQIYASANVGLKRLVLQRGAFGSSHALENFGLLRLDQVTMRNNTSTGPAMLNQGTLIVERSTFAGNTNSGTAVNGRGGAILNDGGTATIRDSTFSGNAATTAGGAIYSNAEIDVSNVTFTGNQTTGAGSGGAAIYQTGSGTSTVTYATVSGNAGAGYGGGIYNDGAASATLIVSRSILANNTNGNCDGVLTSDGYNLWFGTTSCPFSAAGDGAGDPKLGTLASNGGPTQTMSPLAGSPAIDRIPAGQCMIPVDQRGGGRPSGSGCDSGAVEAGATLDLIFYDGFDF